MQAIKKGRNTLAALLLIGAALTAFFLWCGIPEAAFVSGAGNTALLALLIIQSRRLREARLIADNRILAVPSAVITRSEDGETEELEETVVSTFGVLTGGRVYRWGCDGVQGTRLSAIEIDRSRIFLTIGGADQPLRIELPHGLADEQTVLGICRKLKYETGVTASLSGWYTAQEDLS